MAVTSSSFAENKVYTVGIVPQYEVNRLHKIWRPILDQLEVQTGLKFKIRGSIDIPGFELEFMAGKFDFVYMNPLHIMLASEEQGYIPLLRDTGRQLHGVLVVRKDSGINSVTDLNNTKIAFPSPNALGASLMIRQELVDNFHLDIEPEYVKSHDSVYLSVAMKLANAGGGVEATFNRQQPAIRNLLKIIHRTGNVAPHPLAVHPRVDIEVRNKVRDALLALGNTATGKDMLGLVPVRQIGLATIEDYMPLKQMNLIRFVSSKE